MHVGETTLVDVLDELRPAWRTLYVVPLMRRGNAATDYLSRLYRGLDAANTSSEASTGADSPTGAELSPGAAPSTGAEGSRGASVPSIRMGRGLIRDLSAAGHWKLALERDPASCILHYHWLEFQTFKAMFGMLYKMACISLYFRRGGAIVWTLHNDIPHGGRWISANRLLSRWMASRASLIIAHCGHVIPGLTAFLDAEPERFRVVPHPTFDIQRLPMAAARDRLARDHGVRIRNDRPLILMFGQIRPYKNLPSTVKRLLEHREDLQLLVAGVVRDEGRRDASQLRSLRAMHGDRFWLIPTHIEESDMPSFFGAAHGCVFNYRRIQMSGAVRLALDAGLPVVVPAMGCLDSLGTDKAYVFASEEEFSAQVDRMLAEVM